MDGVWEFSGTVALCLMFVASFSTKTSFSEEIPTVEFIHAALVVQDNLSSPLRVKYKIDLMKKGKEVTGNNFEKLYVRTPEYIFMELKSFRQGELLQTIRERYDNKSAIYRGITVPRNGNKEGQINNEMGPFLAGMKMETAQFAINSGNTTTLCEALIKANASLTGDSKIMDGYKCWLVKISNDDKHYYNVWLGQEIGFCPVIVEYVINSAVTYKTHLYDYKEVIGGFWFPMSMMVENSSDGPSNRYRVNDISAGKPVNEEEAKVDFPSGTFVSDLVMDIHYVIP